MLGIGDVFSFVWNLAERLGAVQFKGIDLTDAQEVGGCKVDFKIRVRTTTFPQGSHIPTSQPHLQSRRN